MITLVPPKSSHLKNLLRYLAQQRSEGRNVLSTNLVGRDPSGWHDQIESLAAEHRPRMKKFVKHMILSFAPTDGVTEEKLKEIVPFYLERMGYRDAPYVAFLHSDRPHWHVHIVTTPTTMAGEKISESWDWPRSERIARQIEKRWQLRQLRGSKESLLRAPGNPELHAAERDPSLSLRVQFQHDVTQAGKQVWSLVEWVESMEGQGYSVRLGFDQRGNLRGLSLDRGAVQFTGSQLGRGLSGNRILQTLSLTYDPDQDHEKLKARPRPALRSTELSSANIGAWRQAQEALQVAIELPQGTYQLAGVKPGALSKPEGRLGRGDVQWHRKDWTPQQIEKSQGFLAGQASEVEIVVRSQEADASMIGFRGVSSEKLEALKADGYSPAFTVQVGDRFDIALRTHELLTPDEKGAMRAHLVTTYDLPETQGVYRDAIRMPGLAAPASPGESDRGVATLVATQEGAFPASEWLTEQVRFSQIRQELERLSQNYSIPPELDNQPSVALREALGPAPAFPESSPLSSVHQQVLKARSESNSLAGSHLADLSTEDLSNRLERANAAVVELARSSSQKLDPAATSVRELVNVEAEVARRRSDWLGAALRAEQDLTKSAGRLEAAQARVDRAPSTEVMRAYRQELATYQDELARLDFLERGSAELSLLQVSADRERHAQALVGRSLQEGDSGYRQLVQREMALDQRLGGGAPSSPEAGSLDDRFQQQRTLASLEQTFRQQLSQGRAESLGPYEQAVHDHLRLGQASDRARHQQTLTEAGRQLGEARGDSALSAFLGYSRELSRDPEKVSPLEVRSGEGPNTLQQLARRVADGDLAPQRLRRLNGAIILNADAKQLPAPSFKHPNDPAKLVKRYREARAELMAEAGKLASSPGKLQPHQMATVFSRSSEVIAVHQKLESLHRKVLKIADPGKAPKGISQVAWNLAWLEQAARKGLAAPLAKAHLANAARLPLSALGLASPGRAIAFSYYAARFAMQAATRFAQKVLAQ